MYIGAAQVYVPVRGDAGLFFSLVLCHWGTMDGVDLPTIAYFGRGFRTRTASDCFRLR